MFLKTAAILLWFGASYALLVFAAVEATCADFGLRYAAHDGLAGAVSSHWRWLRRMGRPEAAARGFPTPVGEGPRRGPLRRDPEGAHTP